MLWDKTHNMKKTHLVAVGLGLAQLALHATAGQAQDTSRVLKDVVINASKVDQKQSQTGKVVNIITREQLDRSAGKSIAELLGEQPGIVVNGAGSNPGKDKNLYLRGAGSQYTLILLDGILVNDPSSVGGTFDLRLFPVDQIDHIEILKGGQSTLYGSAAVAGVINIVTKKDAKPGIDVNGVATAGSYGTFKQSIGLNQKVDIFSYNINFTHDRSNGISEAAQPATATIPFDKDGFYEDAVNANFSVKATSRLKISPFVRYFYGVFNYDDGGYADANNVSNAKHFNTGTNAVYTLNNGSLNLSYNYENTRRNYISGLYGPSPVLWGRLNYADLYLNQGIGKNIKLLVGADDRYSQINVNSITDLNNNANLVSGYASVFVNDIASVFNLEAGTRYNHHNVYGDNWTYSVTPSVNILGNRLKAFGNISTSFNAPDLSSLFGQYGANPNLKPERSNSYEAGLSSWLMDDAIKLRLVGYKRKINDAIVYTRGYINQDVQNARGIEFEPSVTINKLNLNAFYTLLDANTITKNPQGVAVQTNGIIRRPKHTFGLFAGYKATDKLYFSLNFRTYSKRNDTYFNMSTFANEPEVLDAYNLLDAYAEYALINKRLKVFVDVKNILNASYMEVYGYNTMGTNFNAGLSFNIRH
jgi:vitamin B12 transporter